MIRLLLPENAHVLRQAAKLLERTMNAQAEYNAFIENNGRFVQTEEVAIPEPDIVRGPDYADMLRVDAIGTALAIHGPLTRPQIAEIIGCPVRSVNKRVTYKNTHSDLDPNPEADYILVGGAFGKGSQFNPATVVLNTVANWTEHVGPIEEEPIIEEDNEPAYADMTIRQAVRTYFSVTNNAPAHYKTVAQAINKPKGSVCSRMSLDPEFFSDGEGNWQAHPQFFQNGWMVIGR